MITWVFVSKQYQGNVCFCSLFCKKIIKKCLSMDYNKTLKNMHRNDERWLQDTTSGNRNEYIEIVAKIVGNCIKLMSIN